MRSEVASAIAIAVATLAVRPADAFLLVSKAKGASLDRASAVALREGDHTVVTLEPQVRGPAGEVALLWPVSAAGADTSTPVTLARRALAPLARVSAPRVVEYWELDPCEIHDTMPSDGTLDTGAAAELAPPPSAPAAAGGGTASPAWAVETSAAKTGAEIAAALKKDGYTVPDRAEAALDGYLRAGMKILIARLDQTKLPAGGDAGALPALQVHVRSEAFTLPARLLAASGARELSLFVIAQGARFEAAGQPNVGVPTNLDVVDGVRAAPAAFYRALLDRTFEKSPGAVITEYAWRASSCDLCASPLSAGDLASWGYDLLPSAGSGKQHEVLVEAASVSAKPDGPADARAAIDACYAKALAGTRGLSGEVSLDVEVGGDGAITTVTPGPADETLAKCAALGVKASKGWKAGAKGKITVKLAAVSRAFFADLVVTALRERLDAASDKDLTLQPGRAMEGGRELGAEGMAEKNVHAAPAGNNFQPRYAVRHAFAGAVSCAAPTRGTWGEPPKDLVRTPPVAPKGADGGVRLESWVQGDLPDFASYAIKLGPPVTMGDPKRVPQTPPEAASTASAAPGPVSAPKSSGCGDCSVGSSGEGLPWGGLLVLAAALGRRRRSVRR